MFSPNFSSKYSPAEKLRTLENESRKIEINKHYSIMYRRLRCMKIFLSIYLVALKRAVFCGTDVTRPRARAEEDARSVHLLIGSMPAVSSGMRGRLRGRLS